MTKSKTTGPKKQFRNLRFYVDQLPGCCGIGVVANFEEEEEFRYYWGNHKEQSEAPWATLEEQAEDCYKRILEKTWGETTDGDEYSTLMITLVSKYKDTKKGPQLPALAALLKKKRWKVAEKFINPNHGNEVTLFVKHFGNRKVLQEDQ